jgi:hypothetical protein
VAVTVRLFKRSKDMFLQKLASRAAAGTEVLTLSAQDVLRVSGGHCGGSNDDGGKVSKEMQDKLSKQLDTPPAGTITIK